MKRTHQKIGTIQLRHEPYAKPKKQIVGSRSNKKRLSLELTLQEIPLHIDDQAQVVRSSLGYGWSDIAAFQVREQPKTTIHAGTPNLWLTMVDRTMDHQRIFDGQKMRAPFPPEHIMLTPPNLTAEDTLFTEGIMFHIFLRQQVLIEVSEELFDKHFGEIVIRPELRARDPSLLHLIQATEHLLQHPFGSSLQSDYIARAIAVQILKNHTHLFPLPYPNHAQVGMSLSQIKRVNDFMLEHIGKDFQLSRLASLTGLSRTAFFERFKHTMKRTPHQHLQIMRIKKAQELLRNGSFSLAEVAITCGFADQTHLTRVFKQYTGQTPGKFRNQTRQNKIYQIKKSGCE